MFKMIKNELKCTVRSVVRRTGAGNGEVAVLQYLETKAASAVILQALYAQTARIFVVFLYSKRGFYVHI